MDPQEAARAIGDAGTIAAKMRRQGVDERRIAIGWGVFTLFFVSLFDHLPYSIAGIAITVGAAGGIALTLFYVRRRRSEAVPRRSGTQDRPWMFWAFFTPYFAMVIAAAMLLPRFGLHLPVPFTIAALAGALPVFVHGIRRHA